MPHGKEGQNSGCVLPCHLFFQFFLFMLFFSENLSHQFFTKKSSKIYIVLCHQFSCDAPTEPRTSVSSIKGPPLKKKASTFQAEGPKIDARRHENMETQTFASTIRCVTVPFSLHPPPQTISLSLFISFYFRFFLGHVSFQSFSDQPGNQQTSVVPSNFAVHLSTFTGQR